MFLILLVNKKINSGFRFGPNPVPKDFETKFICASSKKFQSYHTELKINIFTILQQVILQIYAFWTTEQIHLWFIPLFFKKIYKSISSTEPLIEEDHFIEEEIDNDDIDYMANIFYSHKQDIENILIYHKKN